MVKLVSNNRQDNLKVVEDYLLEDLLLEGPTKALAYELLELLYGHKDWFSSNTKSSNKIKEHFLRNCFRSLMLLCIKHKIPTQAGFVYGVINSNFPNKVKVGSTKDCEARLGTYQTYDPDRGYKLIWQRCSEDRVSDEKDLLNNLTPYQGEWVLEPTEDIHMLKGRFRYATSFTQLF